ncbi:cell division protein [Ligilactobacillus hayakitensis DSM 18933 = JCM 14209]|uniref:Cell division protein n=1 Tax=Ligilactobacillus hayakitensis DSM 18933 = JCM 14209 TaxID=1423755 RepID=A0A0R1WMX1_9LACO|nr:DNA translocase FtsK [Ligilactobacillus hayakitensis]KRM19134.1 cell division protein [Ligilactobacillus hayakitensis DSM 18933 = JCM 14209]
MAKRKKKTIKKKVSEQTSERIFGAVFILIGILGFFNFGYLGSLIANLFRVLVGDSYKLLILIFSAFAVILLATAKYPKINLKKYFGGIITYLGITLFMEALFFQRLDLHSNFTGITWQYLSSDIEAGSVGNAVGGGMIGAALYEGSYFLLSQIGSYILATLIILAGFFLIIEIPYRVVLEYIGKFLYVIGKWLKNGFKSVAEAIKSSQNEIQDYKKTRKEKKNKQEQDTVVTDPTAFEKELPLPLEDHKQEAKVKEPIAEEVTDWNQSSMDVKPSKPEKVKAHTKLKNYQLPSVDLLQDIAPTDQSEEKEAIKRNKKILIETFKSFGVDVELVNTILGPSVTKYELHPAIGVKVSKIVNLTDDLALALAAKDIRIEAPIPGKSLIGIEVPNKKVATIAFKDIISAQKKHPDKPLEVPIGRDVSGGLITANLADMPHLLIAGSTGSGKSVAINGIITSLLMNCPPDEVKLMLVDPKKVELGVYNGVPHLLTPVVTDPKKASLALHKLVSEMEKRYEMFANTGQRNISGYNKMIQRQNEETESEEPLMPYIVAIVDELSDLMMVASNEVEDAIIRLAQMARAAGIHMILATQRPSVDVITGLIKANVPSRMSFAVSSGTDSRTIIDTAGAEKLLGRGDMLFKPIEANKPVRVQGAYISDSDVQNVVQFVKEQLPSDYDNSMEITDEELSTGTTNEAEDDLFEEAVQFVRLENKCSVSLLQRRFRIGYNRAARIVDEMEARGIVGPQEGSKPRKVYTTE